MTNRDTPTSPLDRLHIASPCPADWNAMSGDDRQRHCIACKLNVYNLSGMTRADAETLLRHAEGRICVRYYRRADGTVISRDCPVGVSARLRRVGRHILGAASLLFSVLLGMIGCSPAEPDSPADSSHNGQGADSECLMGIIAPSDPERDSAAPTDDNGNN